MQNATFSAESPAANALDALHAATTLAQVCAASAVDYWRLGFGSHPILPLSAAATAQRLLRESLVLATDQGALAAQESYGLSFYRAVDTLPALYDKTRCACWNVLPHALACHDHLPACQGLWCA